MKPTPCPFCGLSDKDSVEGMGLTPAVALHQWPNSTFVVQCEGCGGSGPIEDDAPKAIAAWNTRTADWRPIASAPRTGEWFIILAHGEPEVGRYRPSKYHDFEPVGDGLFRKVERDGYEWEGFNNFHAATLWHPMPQPPTE